MNGLPLDGAMCRLGTLSGVHVELDRDELKSAGISLATPVYLHLRDIPFALGVCQFAFG